MTIRVAIADDHPIVVMGVQLILQQADGFELVFTSADGDGLLRKVVEARPDVLLLDLHMPRKDGLTVLRELREHAPELKVVLLTGAVTEDEVMDALRLGVRGVLLKEMAPRLLLECLRKVHEGAQWLEKGSIGRVVEKMLRREEAAEKVGLILTRREVEVMRHVVQNLSNEQIAEKLFISSGTVKLHVHSIYRKLGLSGRVELQRYAREQGLI